MNSLLSDGQSFGVHLGDCIPHMLETMPPCSVDMLLTSVPFPAMYAYSDSESDLGNAEGLDSETKLHFGWFFRGVARVMKPGRVAVIHCMQIPLVKRSGRQGLFDFRGFLIRMGQRSGLIYDYDWHVRKNPQKQAITTRSHQLQFAGLEKDRARSRGALGDYLVKFLAPEENAVPINDQGEVSRDNWIALAEGSWQDIHETRTLQSAKKHRKDDDTRHICPLQLDVIDRLVRLYSMKDEVVFDPFMGIGSTGHVALKHGRRAYGCELREDWHAAALQEIAAGGRIRESAQRTLFDGMVAP